MNIGNVKLKNNIALAPMAGVADRAFRELCIDYGAGFTVSEMASSKALTMQDKKSRELLFLSEKEKPAAVQIFGSSPEIMAKSVEKCMEFNPNIIDINMGCPAPKITGSSAGSALMKNLTLAGEIIKEVVKASPVPVTVKFRTGWDKLNINAPALAKIAEAEGASAVTVHGRTKEQMYALPIDFETIKKVKESVKIPVFANGGIKNAQDAAEMFNKTGCDGIMIAQGALGRPWIFSQINAYLSSTIILPDPPVEAQMLCMLKHIKKIIEYKGERVGIREARKHAAWYLKGTRGAAAYRRKCGELNSINDLEELVAEVIIQSNK